MAVGGEDVLMLGGVSNPSPVVLTDAQLLSRSTEEEIDPIVSEIFDLIRDIKDPEHPHTLEELNVVQESHISVQRVPRPDHPVDPGSKTSSACAAGPHSEEDEELWIRIDFTPTVPHCSLATLIGLCLRVKLERNMQQTFKLDICVTEGMHAIEADVNKQINDKERVAAAMENPSLRDMVEECIKELEY